MGSNRSISIVEQSAIHIQNELEIQNGRVVADCRDLVP
jgi:hypothetical protein